MEYSIYRHSEKEFNPGSYFNDSILRPRPFYQTGFEQSLERIVLNEEPQKERNIIDKVFSDKSRTLKSTIKALFNEIQTREKLDYVLLTDISEDICRQHSYLESLKMLNQHNYSLELLNDFTSRKLQFEGNVLKLEQEKRKEYLACWKDLLFLKKYLLSALKDYWNASSSKTFLNIENDKHRGYLQETEAYNWK
jgi:hypothetical protein